MRVLHRLLAATEWLPPQWFDSGAGYAVAVQVSARRQCSGWCAAAMPEFKEASLVVESRVVQGIACRRQVCGSCCICVSAAGDNGVNARG